MTDHRISSSFTNAFVICNDIPGEQGYTGKLIFDKDGYHFEGDADESARIFADTAYRLLRRNIDDGVRDALSGLMTGLGVAAPAEQISVDDIIKAVEDMCKVVVERDCETTRLYEGVHRLGHHFGIFPQEFAPPRRHYPHFMEMMSLVPGTVKKNVRQFKSGVVLPNDTAYLFLDEINTATTSKIVRVVETEAGITEFETYNTIYRMWEGATPLVRRDNLKEFLLGE